LLPIVSCGWNHLCVKPRSYNLGEEKIAPVGSEMVQDGCFVYQWEPTGLNKHLWQRKSYEEVGNVLERELLYAGREGSVLHVTYREYVSNYARQPFFQQLFYDLKTSDKIVFQDWVIQVTDANNQEIKFKVVKEPPKN
jgi:hypothetical protein